MKTDLKQINKFRKEFQGKFYKPWTEKDFNRIRKQERIFFLFARNGNGKLVGIDLVYWLETLTKKTVIIEDIIVDEKYRNKGYGRMLMEQITELAKKLNVDCIEADVRKEAWGFYKKFGFKNRHNIAVRIWLK